MKVLIALDDSQAAHTLEAIGGWATTWNVEAHLLTVLKPGAAHATVSPHNYTHSLTPAGTLSGDALSVQEPIPGLAEDRTQAIVRARTETAERLQGLAREFLPLSAVTVHVEGADDIPQTVVDKAAEVGAGVIVVGTHGRTGLSHALMGSVAEKIVREATIPVLVVGPKVGPAR